MLHLNRILLGIFAGLVLIVISFVPLQASALKIGVIDADRILEETTVGQNAKANFTKELTATRFVLEQQQKRIKILHDSLKISQQINDEETVIEKQKQKINDAIEEYKRLEEALKERLHQKDVEIATRLREKVWQHLADHFIKKQGYCLLVEKQNIVAFCDDIDVTNEAIELLNRLPVEEPAAAQKDDNADKTMDAK